MRIAAVDCLSADLLISDISGFRKKKKERNLAVDAKLLFFYLWSESIKQRTNNWSPSPSGDTLLKEQGRCNDHNVELTFKV